jgi:hypothetical protein
MQEDQIKKLIAVIHQMDADFLEAQAMLFELRKQAAANAGGAAALKAELLKRGLVGLDVDRFCAAQSSEERLQCVIAISSQEN